MRIAGNMGYIVICHRYGAMFLDQRDGLLYFHREVTVFRDKRKAQRAIDATLADKPDFKEQFGGMYVLPLKPAYDDPSYRIEVDRRQNVIVNVRSL